MRFLQSDIICLLIYAMTLARPASGDDCSFKDNPKRLVLVSQLLTNRVKIGKHFHLNDFNDFCLLKVKLPAGKVVTFNITKKLEGDRYFGDILTDQIWVDKNKNLVYFQNTTEEFGPRYGFYYMNGFEILGMYYFNAIYKPPDKADVHIQNCDSHEEKIALIKIDAVIKNDPRIKLCIDYNERKNRSTENYLFSDNCWSSANVSLLNRTIYFPAENLPFKICCKIEDDRTGSDKAKGVEYRTTISAHRPVCPAPPYLKIVFFSAGILFFLIGVIVCGYILFKYNKHQLNRLNGFDYILPNITPVWAENILYNRGYLEMHMEEPIGEGNFGIVYKAIAQQFEENMTHVEVAVKTYPPESIQGHDDLYQEGKVLSSLEYHPNVINLLGITLDTAKFHHRLLLIMELCSKGCLLDFLRKKDEAFIAKTETWTEYFNPKIMTLWSFQISGGMEFLSNKKIIHGDLAARNILLDVYDNIKINDFGKARQVNYDTLAFNVDGVQPLNWMAIEAIQNKQITLQSDIWSFGVTLWEIFSLGHHPYAGRTFQETFEWLLGGNRLMSPSNCPSLIYQVMTETWHLDPKQRPTFSNTTERLKSMVDTKYLEKYWRIQDKQRKVYDSIRNYEADRKDKAQPNLNLAQPAV